MELPLWCPWRRCWRPEGRVLEVLQAARAIQARVLEHVPSFQLVQEHGPAVEQAGLLWQHWGDHEDGV